MLFGRGDDATSDSKRRAREGEALQLSTDTGPARTGFDLPFHEY